MSSTDILPFPLSGDPDDEYLEGAALEPVGVKEGKMGAATLGAEGALENGRREVDATGWAAAVAWARDASRLICLSRGRFCFGTEVDGRALVATDCRAGLADVGAGMLKDGLSGERVEG